MPLNTTNTDKLQTLREHQAWRMGGDGAPPLVADITAAIDYAIGCCEAIQRIDCAVTALTGYGTWYMALSEIRALMESK